MTKLALNGIELNVEHWGAGAPLLALHGFTGSAYTWAPFASAWRGYELIAVDLHGHGESIFEIPFAQDAPAAHENLRKAAPADPARYALAPSLDDIVAILDELGIEKTALLGYSMGGRIALQFALAHPARLSALILESASPGIADAAERAARVRADEQLAANLERDGIEAFIDYWQSIPLWESQQRLPQVQREALRRQRLHNSVYGLANSLRGIGAGTMPYVMDRLHEIKVPTLLIAGALDERYASQAGSMAAAIPTARTWIIEDAGHAAHFESPIAFTMALRSFLSQALTLRQQPIPGFPPGR